MSTTETTRRDWDWSSDGALEGLYVETRSSHDQERPVGRQDEARARLPHRPRGRDGHGLAPAVLKRHFREELQRRGKANFEPGERIRVTPKGKREGENGAYWDFEPTWFEHAAPKPTAAELLDAGSDDALATASPPANGDEGIAAGDDDIPF